MLAPSPVLRIETSHDYWDCDCCGGVVSGAATVTLPDGRELAADHDGHFGNGAWSGRMDQLYDWALQGLGVEIRVNGEPYEHAPYLEQDAQYEWQPTPLAPATREVVNLQVLSRPDPDYPEYELPVSVSWTTPTGEFRQLTAGYDVPGAWDGEVSSLLEVLLRERVDLEVHALPVTSD